MSDIEQSVFQISAKLYQQLDSMPSAIEEREAFLKDMDHLLDERGEID